MNNKLTSEQVKRFDDKFTTGIGGVLVSRGGTSVVSEEVKQHIADEIAMAKEEVEQDMVKKMLNSNYEQEWKKYQGSKKYGEFVLDFINSFEEEKV